MFARRSRLLLVAAVAVLTSRGIAVRAQASDLTVDQKKEFLRTADVIASTHTNKGLTSPWHLTLRAKDGSLTHDASFQPVDEHKTEMRFANGRTELNFVDSYKYNLAAYELATQLGLADMMPVTVERKWQGKTGAIEWWLPTMPGMIDEGERLKQKRAAPDADAWNHQMWKKRVFAQLVYDTDPNLTNLTIGPDWKVYMRDFTRAFRPYNRLENPKDLTKCDRMLFANLKTLDQSQFETATKGWLTKSEIKAVMQRRDLIVDLFQKLAAEKGEGVAFY